MHTLLIVDDEDGIRSLVRMTLDDGAYRILEASKGSSALEMAREHRPDLILLDIMLPDCSGIEICRQLKADPGTCLSTVIMLTARAQQADLGDAERAGADGYFTKPFSPIALVEKVEAVLSSRL